MYRIAIQIYWKGYNGFRSVTIFLLILFNELSDILTLFYNLYRFIFPLVKVSLELIQCITHERLQTQKIDNVYTFLYISQ